MRPGHKICSFPGCGRPHDSRGLCTGHASQSRKGQELTPIGFLHPKRPADLPCNVDDCDELVVHKGYCGPHYRRWEKYGDPLAGGPFRDKTPGREICAAEGCDEKPKGKSGASGQFCAAHLHRAKRYGSPDGLHPDRYAPDATERRCTFCGKVKPLGEFGPLEAGQLGRRSECRACVARKLRRDRAKASPEAKERRRLAERRSKALKAYGPAGLAACERIIAGEGCDICGKRTKRMAIDHDHDTGEVRGILCKDCNLILGWVKDDAVRLRNMAAYLEGAEALAA
jgi:hypothetical protein